MGLSDNLPRGEDSQVKDIADLKRSIRELAPSIAKSFAPVIANLQATIIATIQASYTTTVDLMNLLAGKSNTDHKHAASDIATGGTTGAGFTVGGDLAVNGATSVTGAASAASVTVSGALRGADLYATNAPSYNITGTRNAAWLEVATGRLGTASSSERFKTNIRAANLDPAAVLKLQVVYYQYLAELEQREHDPTYRVATEIGVIAERLHEAGLWQFVIYEREPDGALATDDAGNPVCFGVRYELMALALIPVAQAQAKQIKDLTADIASLKSQMATVNANLANLGTK
jgi:hypothetical protein